MNIIVVSDSLAKTRSVSLSRTQLLIALFGFAMMAYGLGAWLHGGEHARPLGSAALAAMAATTAQTLPTQQRAMMESVHSLAKRLGELQAKLQRLDSFSDQLARRAGVNAKLPQLQASAGGRGGPLITGPIDHNTVVSLSKQLDELQRQTDDRRERLQIIEQLVRNEKVEQSLIPTTMPVATGYYSSNFGYRTDPFTGALALHQGVDFIADSGSDILAAAGGIVRTSELQSEYGNLIEIDHGNGLSSRYAHASKRLVRPGDIVLKGQKIGEVGTTGRSTGPHLHFEVRDHGAAVNPAQFLKLPG